MCRLMGFVAAEQCSAAEALGPKALEELIDLSRLHRDGWGYALSAEPDDLDVYRSPVAARVDEQVASLHEKRARAGIVHLRWASLGLPVREENSHPFVAHPDGPVAFAHNGSVRDHAEIVPLLDEEQRALRRGDTDSELYFLLFLQSLTRHPDVGDALCATVEAIRAFAPVASLNAVLLTDREFCVVHSHTGMPMPIEDLEESCGTLAEVPPAHLEHYFDLSWSERDGVVAVAHTGLTGDWETLSPDSLLRVRREDLKVTMCAL